MKWPLFSLALLFCLTCAARSDERSAVVRVTAYWKEEGQSRAAWNGAKLHNGHCAVDPKKIPYGSKILLGDEELVAVDTGPAVVSRLAARRAGRTAQERSAVVVDRYFQTKSEAVAWQKSHPHFMTARITPPGFDRRRNVSSDAVNGSRWPEPLRDEMSRPSLACFALSPLLSVAGNYDPQSRRPGRLRIHSSEELLAPGIDPIPFLD